MGWQVGGSSAAAFDVVLDVEAPELDFAFDQLDWASYARYVVEVFDAAVSSGPVDLSLVGRFDGANLAGGVHRYEVTTSFGATIAAQGNDVGGGFPLVSGMEGFSVDPEHKWTRIELWALPGGSRMYAKAESHFESDDSITEVMTTCFGTVHAECDGFALELGAEQGASPSRIRITAWRA